MALRCLFVLLGLLLGGLARVPDAARQPALFRSTRGHRAIGSRSWCRRSERGVGLGLRRESPPAGVGSRTRDNSPETYRLRPRPLQDRLPAPARRLRRRDRVRRLKSVHGADAVC